jgi:hypothetical protein
MILRGSQPADGRHIVLAFQAHVELLQSFLAHRGEIVERIEGVLNAQRKPVGYLQDGSLLSRLFEDCFYALTAATHGQSRLRGQLEEAHWASGFRPRHLPGLHNGLVDPAEMMIRGFHLWQQTRWPGRNGRVRYAQTLFNLYLIRCLELLSMRVWDEGADTAGDRLSRVQHVLDLLWTTTPADQPVLVRDARWLIPLAQSPATDDLGAYLEVAERVATLAEADRIEVHKACVHLAAGHLRSQTRYYAKKKAALLEEKSLILLTRSSNALDFALLIQDLVPLLAAYESACQAEDGETRLELANAICQGLSPDPELFVNRVALLGAYSMIEHLFITRDGSGQVVYTPMGRRHVELLQEYGALIDRVWKPLSEDCPPFRPVAGTYSPYGVLYGFSTDLLEHMAFKSLQPDAVVRFGLEDVFVNGDASDGEDSSAKLAWVSGWRKLPHLTPDVQKQFDYPQQFAEEIFERIEQALRRRASEGSENTVPTGRLFILPEEDREADAERAVRYDEPRLLGDRREGRCLLSYKTPGGWVAISKDILTETLAAGQDVRIAGLPSEAAEVLRLMCPELVAPA